MTQARTLRPRTRHWRVWLTVAAWVFASIAPTLSQAWAGARNGTSLAFEVCTAAGQASPTALLVEPQRRKVPGGGALPEHCPYCHDSVNQLAAKLGITGQFHIMVPQDAAGVYSIAVDSMHGDRDPTRSRFVHIDRYTGRVLGLASFADYSLMAKAMAIGIALLAVLVLDGG